MVHQCDVKRKWNFRFTDCIMHKDMHSCHAADLHMNQWDCRKMQKSTRYLIRMDLSNIMYVSFCDSPVCYDRALSERKAGSYWKVSISPVTG